ncbi:MAG: DUF6385 domain-containing protein [Candidatus Gastranaerophilales bacterium]|nr:DUF6385 domain-containing protein [Candidatus Gastranaerophilales bacterium]
MPNNLVFNNVADQLLTQIYGYNGSSAVAILTDSAGHLAVVGTFTASIISSFISESDQIIVGTATDTTFLQDTSLQKEYIFYVFNTTAATTLTAWLQISPTTAESYFVDDDSTVYAIAGNEKKAIVASKYLQYTRLAMLSSATATTEVYYNAQG